MLNMLVETLISSARSSYSHPDSFLSKEAIQAWAGAQAQQNPGEEFPLFKKNLSSEWTYSVIQQQRRLRQLKLFL